MVSFHQQNPAQIRMKPVYVQFSNHKELKTDQANSFQVRLSFTIHCYCKPTCISGIVYFVLNQRRFTVICATLSMLMNLKYMRYFKRLLRGEILVTMISHEPCEMFLLAN